MKKIIILTILAFCISGCGLKSSLQHTTTTLPNNPSSIVVPKINEPTMGEVTSMPPQGDKMKLYIFFSNTQKDPNLLDCAKVYPVQREVQKTLGMGRVALAELFKGPTKEELAEGYVTSLPVGVKIQKIEVKNKVAYVDFDNKLQENSGGSCKVTNIRAQITETLKQFSSTDSVVISINGKTEDILQP